MLKIGITGGIGSGKSTIARIFHTLGIPVFDADSVAKDIVAKDPQVRKQLIQHFGDVVFENGQLNKKYLSALVFNSADKLKLLDSIIHPATIRASEIWMKKQQSPYAIKEAALLFEASTANDLDAIIGVYAPVEMRIGRVMKRNHLSREEVIKRMGKQMNEDEKMNLCDYVIRNDEQQAVIPQVLELHKHFIRV